MVILPSHMEVNYCTSEFFVAKLAYTSSCEESNSNDKMRGLHWMTGPNPKVQSLTSISDSQHGNNPIALTQHSKRDRILPWVNQQEMYQCGTHVIHLQYTCTTHVVYMWYLIRWFTCDIMWCAYFTHLIWTYVWCTAIDETADYVWRHLVSLLPL